MPNSSSTPFHTDSAVHVIYTCPRCRRAKRSGHARRLTYRVVVDGTRGYYLGRSFSEGTRRWYLAEQIILQTPIRSAWVPSLACSCGAPMDGHRVEGRLNTAIQCNARCMGATGPNCECSCAGQNHGAAHAA